MKYVRLYRFLWLLAPVLLGVSSCSKFLDVSPKTELKEGDQFASVSGFYDAVFGIYQKAAEPALYGEDLTFGFLDILAQRYESKVGSLAVFYGATRYDFQTDDLSRGKIGQIWSSMYNTIAHCNYILQNTENGVLSGLDYNIVKGEAIGMRGFLHFELLRLYSPAYLDGANTSEPAIQYMDKFQVTPVARNTVNEVLAKCEADLKEAESLLSVYPTIDRLGTQNTSTADMYKLYRQNHLNFWAVKAALARLYLYKGNKAEALRYAKEVIDSKLFLFVSQPSLIVDHTNAAADLTFSSEHVFSVYNAALGKKAEDVFAASTPNAPDQMDLFSMRSKLNAMYENTLSGYGTDIRNPGAVKSLWFELMPAVVYSRKYYNQNSTNPRGSLIPLIRLSEMYYIAAEASEQLSDAVKFLNVVRVARLIPALPVPASAGIMQSEIEKEYRKEFFAEGQLWHYYKRTNKAVVPDGQGIQMTPSKYVFPYPMQESEYGK